MTFKLLLKNSSCYKARNKNPHLVPIKVFMNGKSRYGKSIQLKCNECEAIKNKEFYTYKSCKSQSCCVQKAGELKRGSIETLIDKLRIADDTITLLSTQYKDLDYSKLEFKCNVCGFIFTRLGRSILQGTICCYNCAKFKSYHAGMSNDDYKIKIKEMFKNKVYVLENFIRISDYIKHKCYKHGEFYNSPRNMVHRKKGKNNYFPCAKCAQEYSTNKVKKDHTYVVNKLKEVHNNNITLMSSYTKMIDHHQFKCIKDHKWSSAIHHILNGQGCPYCFICSPRSKICEKWLSECEKNLSIEIEREYKINIGGKKKARLDGYAVYRGRPMAFEFYGNYYHGNPNVYKDDFIIAGYQTVAQAYAKTINRNHEIIKRNIDLIYIWEDEYRKGLPFHHIRPHPFLRIPLIVRR